MEKRGFVDQGQLPFKVVTWWDLCGSSLDYLNEYVALPAGYVVTRAGIAQIDRHRIKEFLGIKYHLTEGKLIRGEEDAVGTASGLRKGFRNF